MCTKFQVDVTLASSKTILTKNFNLNFALSFSMFSGPLNWGQNYNFALKLERSYHGEHVY